MSTTGTTVSAAVPTAHFFGFGTADADTDTTSPREALTAELERIRNAVEDLGRTVSSIIELRVFITGELREPEITEWLRAELAAPYPVATVVLVDELPDGAPVKLEAISVPDGERSEIAGPTGLPDLVRIGDFIVAQCVPESTGDLVTTTRVAMTSLVEMLETAGSSPRDIVKYNIFYTGQGTAEDWAYSSQARAEIFTGPGPATTGIPVRSLARPEATIQFTMFGKIGSRTRNGSATARPDHHWDWPIPLPHFHGNRVQELGFIGGQVSLAEDASVLFPDDYAAQVRESMRYIENVLIDLHREMQDLTRLTVFYEVGDATTESQIIDAVRGSLPDGTAPELSLVGLHKLAYQQMVIEIEAQFERQPVADQD